MRLEQHDQILYLHAEGLSNRDIAKDVGLSHVTVAKVLKAVTTGVVIPGGNPIDTKVVTDEEGNVLWPSWEPTGGVRIVRIGLSGAEYAVMRPLPPRAKKRG